MTRSLKRKAFCYGAICLALLTYDTVTGLRRGWDIEGLIKDALLIVLAILFVGYEHRYYRRLTAMSPTDRERELVGKPPEERARILLKLKDYNVG